MEEFSAQFPCGFYKSIKRQQPLIKISKSHIKECEVCIHYDFKIENGNIEYEPKMYPKYVFYHPETENCIWVYSMFAEIGENNNTQMKKIHFDNEIIFLNDLVKRGWCLK